MAFLFFSFWLFCFGTTTTSNHVLGYLFLSGLIGLAAGDLLLFKALASVGISRTTLFFAFQPSIVAMQSYFLISSTLSGREAVGILLMFICLFLLHKEKHNIQLDKRGYIYLIIGIALDAAGVSLTKKAFVLDKALDIGFASFIRLSVAIVVLYLLCYWNKVDLNLKKLDRGNLHQLLYSGFAGTFLTMFLFSYALAKESPASISAIAGLTPLYFAIYEHIKLKRSPSFQFSAALFVAFLGVITLTMGH